MSVFITNKMERYSKVFIVVLALILLALAIWHFTKPSEISEVVSPSSGGIYKGEEYVGQFRRQGKIPVPKAASDEWLVSTYTRDEAACQELKAKLNRICSPIQAQSVDTEVATISHFCSFPLKCPKNIVDGGALYEYIKPEEIEPDQIMNIEAVQSWGLDRVDQQELPLNNTYSYDYDGSGQIVYIVDTGINSGHEDYAGRYKGGKDFVGDHSPDDPEDGNGHGTHCAGTALGTKYGIAKKATLYGARCLNDSGSGSSSAIVKAVAWAVKHWQDNHKRSGAGAVLSLSLGGSGKNSGMINAVKEAAAAGAIVVVAAGNSNSDACRFSPAQAGGDARTKIGSVVTVMSSDNKDKRSGFSNYGSCADIYAPGTMIKSAWINGDTATKTISGTSMATPHVAGVAAQLLQKHSGDNKAALKELFTIGSMAVIKDAKPGSPNQLLRVPGTEEVTGPIPQPPSPPKIELSFGSYSLLGTTNDKTFHRGFRESEFGGVLPDVSNTKYPVIFLDDWTKDENHDACKDMPIYGKDAKGVYRPLTGAAVFIDRGDCDFSKKVLAAQKRGAAMVFIVQNSNAVPFSPGCNGCDDTIKIFSAMIFRSSGASIKTAAAKGDGNMVIKAIK